MPYSTRDQVRAVLARDASATSGTGASLTAAAIDDAIAEADAEIDAKLGAIWQVPFVPVPGLIQQISRDIAAYLADLTFREVRDYSSELNPVVLRYKRTQELLKGLSSGSVDLPGATTPSTEQAADGLIVAGFDGGVSVCDADFDVRPPYRSPNRHTTTRSSDWWGIW